MDIEEEIVTVNCECGVLTIALITDEKMILICPKCDMVHNLKAESQIIK